MSGTALLAKSPVHTLGNSSTIQVEAKLDWLRFERHLTAGAEPPDANTTLATC